MRLIKMTGGLGNQMFIYAFYLRMRKLFPNVRIDLSDMMHYRVHNGYELHHIFQLPKDEFCINQKVKKVIEFLFFQTILERKQTSQEAFWKPRFWPLVYFKGFYQSEDFFRDIKEDVRRAFTFDSSKAVERSRMMALQIQNDSNAVSLHIRRGDYLQPKHWEAIGRICQLSYYRNAIAEMEKQVSSPHYYVFSDDLDWVKENLPLTNATYIDWNRGADSWQDMMLMSCCRYHIICNSTFSWWGAWLDTHPEKVVVLPEQWTSQVDSRSFLSREGKWIQVSTN
ncbi:MAG: alpha-1,2-fucosyltransferase [Phocaeicola sp.]|nr:alpha-1,2-fucosyltransferase [Phocaeicola sp.]